jgi:hypothetical protein
MMGRLKRDQGQFFYSFCLDEVVPDDHRVREIGGELDLRGCMRSWRAVTRRWAARRSIQYL